MKIFFQVLIFIVCSNSIYGQIDTIKNENGSYEVGTLINGLQESKWKSYYMNGKVEYEGSFLEGKKVGKWIWYHENGQILSKETYFNDILTKSKFWDIHGKRTNASSFKKEAEYPGGLEAFRTLLEDSMIYPEKAIEYGIRGRVNVQFQVNSKGELFDIKIMNKTDPLLGKEAVRVIMLSSGKWNPGVFHSRPINSKFLMPVIFQLK